MVSNYTNGESPINQLVPTSLDFEQATSLIIERAKQLVNQLVEERGHDKPPFLAEDFAHWQGINKIMKTGLIGVGALLLRFHDGPVIQVNENDPPVRQNFSCAHEIGHILFSELKLEHYIRSIEYRTTFNPQARDKAREKAKERLCNIAATELLMPESVFQKYLLNFGLSIYSIERLAYTFRVSIQTAAIRIAEVSTEPCIMLLWKLQKRAKGKTLRFAWRVGPGMKPKRQGDYALLHNDCPATVYNAFQSNKATKCNKLFKIDTTVKRLPMESKGFSYNENRYVISLAFPNR